MDLDLWSTPVDVESQKYSAPAEMGPFFFNLMQHLDFKKTCKMDLTI